MPPPEAPRDISEEQRRQAEETIRREHELHLAREEKRIQEVRFKCHLYLALHTQNTTTACQPDALIALHVLIWPACFAFDLQICHCSNSTLFDTAAKATD